MTPTKTDSQTTGRYLHRESCLAVFFGEIRFFYSSVWKLMILNLMTVRIVYICFVGLTRVSALSDLETPS